jgi:hypothetical protein
MLEWGRGSRRHRGEAENSYNVRMASMRGLALIVVDKKWATTIKADRAFLHGEEADDTVSYVAKVISRDSPIGLLAEGLSGLGKRKSPLRVLIPWQFVWAVIDSVLFDRTAPSLGFFPNASGQTTSGRQRARKRKSTQH